MEWEYKVLSLKPTMKAGLKGTEQINKLAYEGWELFIVEAQGLGWPIHHYFRREKKNEK